MSELMQKKFNRKWKVVVGVASFLVAFFGFVAISGFIFEFNHMLYKERAYHLNETAAQITETIDVAIDEQWYLLQLMSVRFSAFDDYSTEECVSKIALMERKLGRDDFIFGIIDKDGTIFTTKEDAFEAYKNAKEKYIKEAADKWGISQRRVAVLCSEKRISRLCRLFFLL